MTSDARSDRTAQVIGSAATGAEAGDSTALTFVLLTIAVLAELAATMGLALR